MNGLGFANLQGIPSPIIFLSGFMTFPALAPDGTITAPSYSFTSDPSSGMWLNPGGNLTFSCNGNDALALVSNGPNSAVVLGAGTQLQITPGTDQPAGSVTLVGGTAEYLTTRINGNCVVLLQRKTANAGPVGNLTYIITTGKLTINSDNAGDVSTVDFLYLRVQ